jgi:RNA polymerase-binding transcription factor DksA
MTEQEREGFRDQLLGLRDRLRNDFSSLTAEALRAAGGEASGNLSNAPLHFADLGTDNSGHEVTLSLMETEGQAMGEVLDALRRLEEGTFGRCERCGDEIPSDRLRAVPSTRYCVGCARRAEQGESDAT